MPRGNVRVSITSDPSGLERGNLRAERSLEKLGKTGAHHLGNLAKAAGGLAAAYVGIEAAKGAVETTESLAASTIKLKRNFGLTAQAASTWSAVLKVNNIDQASAMMSFTTLSKAINGGSKSAVQAFKDLGLTQKDLKSQNFGQTLDDVTAALTRMHGGSQRAADAQILLGRGAKLLAPLFRGDGLGFQQQAKWAEKYGVTLNGHALKSSKDLAVATTQLKFAQMGMQIEFSEKVVPVLTKGATALATFVGGMRDGTGAGGKFAAEAKKIGGDLKPVLGTLKDIGSFVASHPIIAELLGGGLVAGKVASKFSGPLSALTGAAKTLTGAGLKPIPVYIVNGPAGGIPGASGGSSTLGKVLHNPVVGGVAGATVVGGVALLGIDASKKSFQGFTDAVVKNQARIKEALRTNDPEFAKLRDYIDKLAQQAGGPFTADAKRAAEMLDRLEGSTRKSSSAIRDASDANYGYSRSQQAALQHADELANKVIGIGRAGGNAANAFRRLHDNIQSLPQRARIDIIASVSETFRIGAHPSGGVTTTKRTDGTTFKSAPGAASGGVIPGPKGAGDIVPLWTRPGEVVLTEQMQHALGRDRVLNTVSALGGRILGAGAKARTGGVIGPRTVAKMQSWASSMASRNFPYVFGGGHAGFGPTGGGFDCSGFVSGILGVGGAISSPMAVREPLASALVPGPGRYVTVGIRGTSGRNAHTMIKVGNRYFESGGGGNGAHERAGWNGAFEFFHPRNEAVGSSSGGASPSLGANGTRRKRKSQLVATSGNTTAGIPGVGTFVNGSPVPMPTTFDATDTGAIDSSSGGTDDGSQAAIDALNRQNALLQQLVDLTNQKNANTQKMLNVSQAQYPQLFASFVAAISGEIGGRVGLGSQTPSSANVFASY